jgi:hypothetical protein
LTVYQFFKVTFRFHLQGEARSVKKWIGLGGESGHGMGRRDGALSLVTANFFMEDSKEGVLNRAACKPH